MRLPFSYALLLFCLFSLAFIQKTFCQTPVAVADLRCEYLQNPLGIDAVQPRFTWRLADERQGANSYTVASREVCF